MNQPQGLHTDAKRRCGVAGANTMNDASQGPHDPLIDEGFILLKDLKPIVPLHEQHIRKLARRGDFPTPLKIGGRTAFRRRDILDWVRKQKAVASSA